MIGSNCVQIHSRNISESDENFESCGPADLQNNPSSTSSAEFMKTTLKSYSNFPHTASSNVSPISDLITPTSPVMARLNAMEGWVRKELKDSELRLGDIRGWVKIEVRGIEESEGARRREYERESMNAIYNLERRMKEEMDFKLNQIIAENKVSIQKLTNEIQQFKEKLSQCGNHNNEIRQSFNFGNHGNNSLPSLSAFTFKMDAAQSVNRHLSKYNYDDKENSALENFTPSKRMTRSSKMNTPQKIVSKKSQIIN